MRSTRSATNRSRAVALGIVLGVGLTACSSTTTPETPTSPAAAPVEDTGVTLTEADNGETVQANVGETLTLTLPETAGTGYTWQPVAAPDEAILKVDSDEVVPAEGDAVGAPGEHVWHFTAVAVGSAVIDLASVPPGEEVSKRYSAYTVTVEVVEPGSG